ncbi:unnamed protein product, partial [Closterium sp. NIES-53]
APAVGARGDRVGVAAAGATVARGAAAAAGARAATAAAAAVAAVAAATSCSCLWSSDPRSPLSFSSLPPSSSRLWSSASSSWPLPRCFPSSSSPVVPSSFLHLAFMSLSSCSSPVPSLTASLSTPVRDYYRTYRPLSRVLASLVIDPRASLSSVSALTAAITDFASTRCLDYATSLVAAPLTSPLAVGGESALGCDALEDRQFELEFLAAASPHLCTMLLAPEGDRDALNIPTPRTYAEAVSGPWASQWRAAMDSEMASYISTSTYVDEVPPP